MNLKSLVISLCFIIIIFYPTISFSQEIVECQFHTDRTMTCDGEDYIFFPEAKGKKLLNDVSSLEQKKKEISLLKKKIFFLEESRDDLRDINKLYKQYNKENEELVSKLIEKDNNYFYNSNEFWTGIGFATAGLMFFGWEWARNPDN